MAVLQKPAGSGLFSGGLPASKAASGNQDLLPHSGSFVGGGKRRTDMRAVVNGLMYILSTAPGSGVANRIRQSFYLGRNPARGLSHQVSFGEP
jgi:hypothetical protein